MQSGRQSGLSLVYGELLDFRGSELYLHPAESFAGKSFRSCLLEFEDSVLLGVMGKDGTLHLPPAMEQTVQAGEHLVLISEDDSTLQRNGKAPAKLLMVQVRVLQN